MTRLIFGAVLLGAGVVAFRAAPADPVKPSPRADTLDLLFFAGEKPVRLELRVAIDGKPVPAVWDETFAALLAFHDRDGSGALDKAEAGRLPSAFALRQVLWGQFTPFAGPAPQFAELDINTDGKIDGAELADFYRRAGLGGVLVGVGKPPATDRLTDALLKALDANKDGKLDEAECKGAADALRKLDANDDELIGPGELAEKIAYPGATGAILMAAATPDGKPDATVDALPFAVLPLRTADERWAEAVSVRREKLKLPAVRAELRTDAPTAWAVNLGTRAKDAPRLCATGDKPPADARLRLSVAATRFELRADDGKLAELTAAARKRFAGLFAECDADADDALDAKELGATKAVILKQLAASADRDADGTLTEKEFAAWLDLQERVAKSHVLLTVLDHGRGLFELLDADRDGALSARELRDAWGRLTAAGCVTGGAFDRAKLPRQLVASVSRGHPLAALGKPDRGGPEWFRAMDRNSDGDISKREFTGPANVFDTLDADKDGLLSAAEADKAGAKK